MTTRWVVGWLLAALAAGGPGCAGCEPPAGADAAGDDAATDASAIDQRPLDAAADGGHADRATSDQGVADQVRPDVQIGCDSNPGSDAGYAVDEIVGTIQVREYPGSSPWAAVTAIIFDGPTTSTAPEHWFTRVAGDALCELRQAAFVGDFGVCDPACTPPQFCTPALTCEDEAQLAPAGTLTFGGLSHGVSLSPTAYGYDYADFMDGNAFAPAASVTVSAAGGVTPAFTLSAHGVEDLLLLDTEPLVVHDNEDLTVQWVPGTAGDLIEVYLTPRVHAFAWMFIRCRVADSGQLIISRDLLQHFPHDTACTHGECASHSNITRYSEDHHAGPNGVIRLRVESTASIMTQRVP